MMHKVSALSLSVTVATTLLLGMPSNGTASVLYAQDYLVNQNLYTANQTTGALTLVGNTGRDISDLTSDNNNRLWGADPTGNRLLRLNPANASIISDIAITGANTIVSLAYDDTTGTLFGNTTVLNSAGSSALYTTNTASGAATLIGNLTTSEVYGLGFNTSGQLYGWDAVTGSLYTIDKTTGLMTSMGATTPNTSMFDVAFRLEDDILFASNAGAIQLETVNPGTGVPTLVGLYGVGVVNVAGLAFLSDIPEPATLAVLGIGFGGVACLRPRPG